MANALFVRKIYGQTIGTSVTTITPSSVVGSVVVKNLSTAPGPVWVRFDGTDPLASFGDDRLQLNPGDSIMLNPAECSSIKAIAANAGDGLLQVIVTPASGQDEVA